MFKTAFAVTARDRQEKSLKTFPRISKEFTDIILERELTLVLDNDQRTLVLRFGKPIQDVETVDSFDWRCPVQLIGSGKKALHPGVGVDSLQALINAIKIAQIELESLEHETGGEVRWLNQRGYGLPQI
jgi:hypothetical protein